MYAIRSYYGHICRREQITVIDRADTGVRSALKRLDDYDREFGYVIDKGRRFVGVVSVDTLRGVVHAESPAFSQALIPNVSAIPSATLLNGVMSVVAQSPCPVPVVDDKGRYLGAISIV